MRQKSGTIAAIGLVMLAILVGICMLLWDIESDVDEITVSEKLIMLWETPAVDTESEFDTESSQLLVSYYGQLSAPLAGSLAVFEIWDDGSVLVCVTEYDTYRTLELHDGCLYYDGELVFTVYAQSDNLLTIQPSHRVQVDDNVYRIVPEGPAMSFTPDRT